MSIVMRGFMKEKNLLKCVMIILLMICVVDMMAEEVQKPQTQIKCSGPMDVDYATNVATFYDDVFVNDPDFKMWSDEMTVYFNDGMQTIKKVIAVGSVKLEKEERRAKSEHAVYTVNDGRIVLTGDPMVKKGEDVLTGDKITFFRDDNRMLIEPKAKLIIYSPDDSTMEDDFF